MSATEHATLAGGCFWCLEAVYDELKGVKNVDSGYTGGRRPSPTYEQVCTGTTGHAEVVRVEFDPAQVSYRQLLEVFFSIHDPTQLNRQGNDIGTQYRSAIFYENDEQRRVAQEIMAEIEREDVYGKPITTQLEPLKEFWPAEEYHRDYYARNPGQGYCAAIIAPKLAKFRKNFETLKR